MSKLAIHIFNQSIFDGKLPNKDIINDLGIYWAGVADKKPFYNIDKPIYSSVEKELSNEEIKQSILSLSNNLFTVENKHPLLTIGDVYKPFDLLLKVRFKGNEKDAESYLIEQGYNDVTKYIDSLIFDGKGKFDAYKASEFLKSMGYIRVSEVGRDEITIYRKVNGVMKSVNIKSDTVSIFMAMIKGHPKEAMLSNELHKARASVNNVWLLFEGTPYDLQMDTKNTVYRAFSNGVAKITKGKLEFEIVNYDKLKLFIETESMKHVIEHFDIQSRKIGNFEKFFRYAIVGHDREELTEKEAKDVLAFYSVIGYLLSNFKDLALNKAIIFSDAGADDVNRNGRRGKTLIMQALRMFTPTIMKGGTEFDPNYRHNHAGTESIHKLYFIDDVPRNFNYHALYTNISGGISAERKGTKAVEIPYSHSPKFMITTNWVVPRNNNEASTIARFAEYQLSNFFNASHTPQDYFNEVFFQDWDKEEWQLFHEFMLTCIMMFLNDGLIEIEYSKEADNYFAYFSNSVIEEEMQRIMNELKTKTEFTVTDFLREHSKENLYKYKPIFNSRNSRDRINVWIEYHKLNCKYTQHKKIWESFLDNDNDNISVNNSKSLPF